VIRVPLRKKGFSCSQKHPDLESRLTFQEKGVLAPVPRNLLTGARNGLANVKADDTLGLFELGAVDRQLRIRLPVAARIALATAGFTADVPGSPTPLEPPCS
jgi:hypothetical protein